MNKLFVGGVGLAIVLSGCGHKPTPCASGTADAARDTASSPQKLFPYQETRLLQIAHTYITCRRSGREPRWAPIAGEGAGRAGNPGFVNLGFSSGCEPLLPRRTMSWLFVHEGHDGFLFSLPYVQYGVPNALGHVVVKEAGAPEASLAGEGRKGEPYHAREKDVLWIMYKAYPQEDQTDKGWVYGTLTGDGKKVLAYGRVETCMACHRNAPYDRLFGPTERGPDNSEVDRLIRQLGDESYVKREAASKALYAIGGPALDALRKAASANTDLEIRRRANALVEAIPPRIGGELRSFRGHTDSVLGAAFSTDGRQVFSGSLDRTVCSWDVVTGERHHSVDRSYGPVSEIAMSTDGSRGLSLCNCAAVQVWEPATGKELLCFCGNEGEVRGVAISPDGTRALSAAGNGKLLLWDTRSGGILRRWACHGPPAESVAFSPDGKLAVSGSWSAVQLWNLATGEELWRCTECVSQAFHVAFSPDGRRVVVGANSRTVYLLDTQTGRTVRELRGPEGGDQGVTFSPDGRRLLSCGDEMLSLWDVETGKELCRIRAHLGGTSAVAFSPDGRFAASGGRDNMVRLWALPK